MHKPTVMQADVDKRSKVDHVEDGPHQLHTHFEVFEFEYALLEEWPRQVLARITAGPRQLLNNVVEQQSPNLKLLGQRVEIQPPELLGECVGAFPPREILHTGTEPLEHSLSDGITLRMDPGGIQRITTAADLEKAGCLHIGGLPKAGNLSQLLTIHEGPLRCSPFCDPFGNRLTQS